MLSLRLSFDNIVRKFCQWMICCLLQEFDISALFHILSSLLAGSLSDTLPLTPAVVAAVFEVILNASENHNAQCTVSFTQSTST